MSEFKIFQVERPWGNFRQYNHNSPCTVKIITVKPNEILSLQSHQKRAEFWHVLSGDGTIQINENKYEVKDGDEYHIPIGAKHRMSGGSSGLEILEISTGDFDEADVVRYEDKYGRS
ncbi:MAG: phosphomannose isomerase type II C-terminal cupin domain [Patescibacteria group bacterium]